MDHSDGAEVIIFLVRRLTIPPPPAPVNVHVQPLALGEKREEGG